MRRSYEFFSAIRACKGKRALGKAMAVSVLNQVVSSGTNFAMGIYLVRVLSPEDFGLYGIGFAISLFFAGIGNALFLTQMVINSPDKTQDDRSAYAGRILLLLSLFCMASVLFVSVLLFTGCIVWDVVRHYVEFASAVTTASTVYLLKEFFVRHAYNVRRETWTLAINGTIACTMAALLWGEHQCSAAINVEMALWIYSVAHAASVIVGLLLSKLPVAWRQLRELRGDLLEAWHYGKWASITNLVYFARANAHTIVVTALMGPVGVAKINAARILVTPAVMLTPALSQLAMPRLAALRAQGDARVVKFGSTVTLVLLSIALLYSTVLLVGYDVIVPMVVGKNYQDIVSITVLWCVFTCLLALRNGAEIPVQVLRKFRGLSVANTYSAIASLVATYCLSIAYGIQGALIGLIIGETALILLLCGILKQSPGKI